MDLADGNQQEIIAENKEQIRAMAKGEMRERKTIKRTATGYSIVPTEVQY